MTGPAVERAYHVLFLCTGNSARSILAECLLEDLGGGRFRAWSAGSHPTGKPHPAALRLLEARGHDTGRARSKSWDEFAGPEAPPLDLVITVCDAARGEACPIWPGRPASAHWGMPDPAAVEGDEAVVRAAFEETYALLRRRIEALVALPVEELDRDALVAQLRLIGEGEAESGTG